MLGDQPLELADKVLGAAKREICVDAILKHGEVPSLSQQSPSACPGGC